MMELIRLIASMQPVQAISATVLVLGIVWAVAYAIAAIARAIMLRHDR